MIDEKRLIIWSIIGTGISSITVQLVTIREFLSQFHGNEITISLVLFCWLLLTGLGSLITKCVKRSSLTLYSLVSLLIALWPLPQIIFIREFREAIFIHGASFGFHHIFFYIMATTTPYCVMVGFILPYAQKILEHNHGHFTSGKLYITDSIGDITGGLAFSFILVYLFKPFKTIAFTSITLIIVALLLLISSRRYFLSLTAVLLTSFFCFFSMNSNFEKSTMTEQYGNIIRYVESPYGRIVITKEGPQHTFWESGVPLYSDADIVNSEEKVHYPLSQLERVKNVLLVSGGLGETLAEVSKYGPKNVDYVELDPHMTSVALNLGFIKRIPFLTIKNTDGRSYIKNTEKKYDAIIIDLPDPDSFQINRFFTSEFFSLTKRILTKEGILSFSLKYSSNYLSDIMKKKLSIIANTARLHFKNIRVLPGEKAFFLCRDGALSTDIPAKLRMKSIETTYVEGFYEGNVTKERIKGLQDSLEGEEYLNRDFEPRVMGIVFQEWFMKHGTSPRIFFFILIGLSALYLIFIKREEYILFSTGMATMCVEILVIFAFQVIYGCVYMKIGTIITAFLSGLLPGAIIGNLCEKNNKANLMLSDVILLCMLLIFFLWINFFKFELHQLYFLAYCFIFSFFCGFQFPVATKIIGEKKSPAAGCLAADLTGAAVGTIVMGTFLIPLWGIRLAIIFLILIKISSNMVLFFLMEKRHP